MASKEVMASEDPWAEESRMSSPVPKQTSISAHLVQSITVNMTFTEMNILIQSFGKKHDELSVSELDIQREFTQAVESVRFPVA